MRAKRLIVLIVIAALASLSTTSSPLAAPGNFTPLTQITMLPGTAQQISTAGGNQTNPHVQCNIASYTNDDLEGSSTIRYLDYATNTEHVLPGNSLDRLSDTNGQQIVFTELSGTGDRISLYDLASQTTTVVPGVHNFDPAIGGNLVAFVQGIDPSTFQIGVYDRNTGIVTQITNDTLSNRDPAVSPDGKFVVWQKCQANGSGCDIYSATQTGPGAFTTRLLTGAGEDTAPDTNGQLVVYLSDKSGDNDIYMQRVDGSSEMHLALPGDQRDLRISGNLLVFESQTGTSYDVFLYDLTTARLYQATNTPDASETLSDVVTGCNGVNRIVYAVPGPFGDFDVWGFNFQLKDSTTDQLNDLIALVQSFNLHDGTETSLISKVQDALAAVNASDTATACASLTAFINASQAQSGKKLTAAQVGQLISAASQIKTDLGCQ
jgi:hypothetical protein